MLEFGLDAEMLEFESLMSYPKSREVRMLSPIKCARPKFALLC